jgi:hypothetical protein
MQRLADGCAILTTASLIGRWLLPMHPLDLLEQTLCTAADMRLLRRMWYFVMAVEDPLVATRLLSGDRSDRNQHCRRS